MVTCRADSGALPGSAPASSGLEAPVRDAPWHTVVWNDPVNLMTYVEYVFRSYFGYSQPQARRLMLQVHNEGRAVVSRGGREQVEMDVRAMHAHGLQATMERAEN